MPFDAGTFLVVLATAESDTSFSGQADFFHLEDRQVLEEAANRDLVGSDRADLSSWIIRHHGR